MKYSIDQQWLEDPKGLPPDALKWAEGFGKFLAKSEKETYFKKALTTSQLRKFFGEAKRIQLKLSMLPSDSDPDSLREYINQLNLLRPKLAYAKGRDLKKGHNQSKIEEFHDVISEAITMVKPKQYSFINFFNLVEAIVAYHKAYGGESNANN